MTELEENFIFCKSVTYANCLGNSTLPSDTRNLGQKLSGGNVVTGILVCPKDLIIIFLFRDGTYDKHVDIYIVEFEKYKF